MGKPMGPKGSVIIFVPLLEVIWKKEWPNHSISTNPEAAAGTRKGALPLTRFGFLQAASTCPEKTKRQTKEMIGSTKKLEFFLISTSHIMNNAYGGRVRGKV
jgi:hypothetical protein